MVWTYIGVLALVLAVVAAGLVVTFVVRGRKQFTDMSGAFRCRMRLVHGWVPGLPRRWQGRPTWATWTHDVLLVRRGTAPATTNPFPVRFPEGSLEQGSAKEIKGLGPDPLRLRLRLDEGAVVEVAAPAEARSLVVGPFVVAALGGQGSEANDVPPPNR